MRAKLNRRITDDEIRVVRIALQRCAEIPEAPALISAVTNLRVVGGCKCGCASVDFANESSGRPKPIADGLGIVSNGERVGIIVWGTPNGVTGLEIYDLSTSATGLLLSDLQSIIPWEEAAS